MFLMYFLIVVAGVFFVVKMISGQKSAGAPAQICTACGSMIYPEKVTRGSFVMEIVLWLLFILPGLIYSIWRLTTRKEVCPKCKSDKFIPADSPKGRELQRNIA
jgi:hypothetical protein